MRLVCVIVLLSVFLVGVQSDCPNAPSEPQDRRTDKSVLTVATYNPEWLFLSNEEDPSSCPEVGCMYPTLSAALEHVQQVAVELQKLDADIVNLIEVEGCEVLDVLLSYIGEEYGYKRYLIQGTDTYTGQNVGLITRVDPIIDLQRTNERVSYPVSNTTCQGSIESDDYGVSKNYHTKFNVNGTVINMFSVHFLSRPDDMERCFKREAQASVMVEYMRDTVKFGEKVIVLGDMNDFDPTLVDINNDVPISNVMYLLSHPFPFLFQGNPLVNVGTTVPFQDQRFSNWYDRNDDCKVTVNELSVIDHMLIDSSLMGTEFSSARYVHSYAPTCATAVSDHWPVFTKLKIE